MKNILSILFVSIFTLSIHITNAVPIDSNDYTELIKLYNSLAPEVQANFGDWLTPGQESYNGIGIDPTTGKILSIQLYGPDPATQTSALPPDLNLSELNWFNFFSMNFDNIPTFINLPSLTSIRLYKSLFNTLEPNATITDFALEMSPITTAPNFNTIYPNLTSLSLTNTKIGGNFPYYPNLTYFYAAGNYFDYNSFEWLKAIDQNYYNDGHC